MDAGLVVSNIEQLSYLAIVIALLASSISIPIPEDIVLVAAGYLASKGILNIWVSVFVCFFAILVGDSVTYCIGRNGGVLLARILPNDRLEKARRLFESHGGKAIFISRFLVSIRVFFPAAAGALGMPWRKFIFYDALAALILVPALNFLGYFSGPYIDRVFGVFASASDIILLVLLIVVVSGAILSCLFSSRLRQAVRENFLLCKWIKKGETTYETRVFGNPSLFARKFVAKMRPDGKISVLVGHLRNGIPQKFFCLRKLMTKKGYALFIERVAKKLRELRQWQV